MAVPAVLQTTGRWQLINFVSQPLTADEVDEIANPAGIAPLIVVPGNDLHQIADYQS
jgi:hypothetical protein